MVVWLLGGREGWRDGWMREEGVKKRRVCRVKPEGEKMEAVRETRRDKEKETSSGDQI